MTNTFMNAVKADTNYKRTENGAVAKKSTLSKVYDLFALGGAYRSRSEGDVLLLFTEAFAENQTLALRCLTYLRDIAEGQGERRFFRVCLKWLGRNYPEIVKRNIATWIEGNYIRWDDLFVLFDTPSEKAVMAYIQKQLTEDMTAYRASENASVSLCAKWMPSENTSSAETRHNARRVINAIGLSAREYRKMLSMLRERIKVVERLMSQNRWEEIDFSKLPSRAGLIYRNAFKNRDLIAAKYKAFAEDKDTTVNASTLYPYDVVKAARNIWGGGWYSSRNVDINDTERLMVNKYWDNLKDYFNGATLNGMVVCDTSGSMTSGSGSVAPIDVAISLALYTAERAGGPFANSYISFSARAKFIETRGVDFCDKVRRIYEANLCENTNLESVFDLVLDTAMRNNVAYEDMPKTLIIVSDMEVDDATNSGWGRRTFNGEAFMDTMRRKWENTCHGWYDFPNLVYWNVDARQNTFLEDTKSGITYVSGCSPVLYEQILKGVTGEELMLEKLNSARYENIA